MEAYHGTAGSPLLYKDRVILYQDQFSGSFVAAFDTRTGKQLWRTRASANIGWGTPIAVRVGRSRRDHREQPAGACTRTTPPPASELWRCGGMSYEVIPTPVVGYGMVFCSSGRAGPTLAIKPGRQGRRDPQPRGLEHAARLTVRAVADPVSAASCTW